MHKWYPIQVDLSEVIDRLTILHIKYTSATDGKLKSELSAQLMVLENGGAGNENPSPYYIYVELS